MSNGRLASQLIQYELAQDGRHRTLDFHADGSIPAATLRGGVDRRQQIVGGCLVEIEITGAGDAKAVRIFRTRFWIEEVDIGSHQLLERDSALAETNEARKATGELDVGEVRGAPTLVRQH